MFSFLFSLALPLGAYALGLGEMKVESALNQPFLAEIELIDGHEVSLSTIKVELADPKSYQSLGVERSKAISILFLDVKKNKQGKFVVEVHSKERMIEPYMQLIVDLTWPKGQIFKIYTVLLDPPGYKLANTTAQRSLIYQRKFTNYHHTTTASTKKHAEAGNLAQKKKAAYGPTSSKENVWQIAQRYKTSEAILPQIVLAIVGANPDAFIDGNLNGLKAGARLKIPSNKKFLEVPADLATIEVMAHDKAWNEKTSINHVLAPPYITGQVSPVTPVAYSQIPPAPKFPGATASMLNQNLPEFIMPSSIPSLEKQVSPEQSRTLKAEISITTAAVDSLRESNALLTEQLSLLQAQNKKLQKQLDVRDKELQLTRKQIQTLMKEHIAIAGQRSATNISNQTDDFWILLILLFVAGGGCIAAFYYFKQRDLRKKQSPITTGSSTLIASSHPASTQSIMSSKEELVRKEPLEEVKSELKSEPGLSPESHSEFKSEPGLNVEPELKTRTELELDSTLAISSPMEKMNIESDVSCESTATDEEPLLEIIPAEEENESSIQTNEEQKSLKDKSDNLLEFESGLHYLLTEKPATKENNAQEQISDEGNGLDFTFSVADIEQTQKDDESKKLINLKNQKALDTLLALAKTYIGMEDTESALNSLNEVMEHGSKSQKEETQRLIDAIHEKS